MAGITAEDWADKNGYSRKLVHAVLSGTRKCVRGKSKEIATKLELHATDEPADQHLASIRRIASSNRELAIQS